MLFFLFLLALLNHLSLQRVIYALLYQPLRPHLSVVHLLMLILDYVVTLLLRVLTVVRLQVG